MNQEIADYRKKYQFSAARMAALLGITETHYKRVEKGQCAVTAQMRIIMDLFDRYHQVRSELLKGTPGGRFVNMLGD